MKGLIKGHWNVVGALVAAALLALPQAAVSGTVTNGPSYGQAPAQQRQAVPGTINYVEGQATLNGQPLGPKSAGDIVAQPNQTIETQAGYVEVLLTPGAFLRIGHNSQVVMPSLGLANLQIQLVHGTAMIEVADLVKGTTMSVNLNGATVQIEKKGLYEFDADQQLARVLDGKAKIIEAARTKTIGKGDQIALNNPDLKSNGFDKKTAQADPLYVWSKVRSQTEAQANLAVAQNVAVYGGWYGPGWYWDPFWAEYAFLPGAGFLYSPFGWGWGFYSPAFVYTAPVYYGVRARGFYHPVPGVRTAVHGYAGGFHGGFHGGGMHR